jgi:hypothetical protein
MASLEEAQEILEGRYHQVWHIVAEKDMPPKQSHGLGHVKIRVLRKAFSEEADPKSKNPRGFGVLQLGNSAGHAKHDSC